MDYQSTYISKDLKNKLKYCTICTNKLPDIRYGALCKLSGGIPTFKGNCGDFKFDNEEYESLRKEVTNDYLNEKHLTSLNEDVVYKQIDIEGKKINHFQITTDKTYTSNTISKMYLSIAIVTIFFVFILLTKEFDDPQAYIWSGFLFFTAVSYILFFFLKAVNKITVSKDYIELQNYKKTRIHWDELLSVHPRISKQVVKGVDNYKFGAVFDLIVGDSYEYEDLPFPIESLLTEFIETIEYRRKYFFDNSPLYNGLNGNKL